MKKNGKDAAQEFTDMEQDGNYAVHELTDEELDAITGGMSDKTKKRLIGGAAVVGGVLAITAGFAGLGKLME